VLARDGAVASMLGLAAHPGVDANALPLALAVLESVLAADPEARASQVHVALRGCLRLPCIARVWTQSAHNEMCCSGTFVAEGCSDFAQLRATNEGVAALLRPLSPNRNLGDAYAAVLPAIGIVTAAARVPNDIYMHVPAWL
jgi:hypothetical protein